LATLVSFFFLTFVVSITIFDAINRIDYSDEHWNQIEDHRKRNHRDPPKTDLYDFLTSQLGYQDAFRIAEKTSVITTTKKETVATAESKGIDIMGGSKYKNHIFVPENRDFVTCWANTRIDYMFMSKNFPGKVTEYKTIQSEASDHYPLVIDVDIN
jgi:hypothetical protein